MFFLNLLQKFSFPLHVIYNGSSIEICAVAENQFIVLVHGAGTNFQLLKKYFVKKNF